MQNKSSLLWYLLNTKTVIRASMNNIKDSLSVLQLHLSLLTVLPSFRRTPWIRSASMSIEAEPTRQERSPPLPPTRLTSPGEFGQRGRGSSGCYLGALPDPAVRILEHFQTRWYHRTFSASPPFQVREGGNRLNGHWIFELYLWQDWIVVINYRLSLCIGLWPLEIRCFLFG